jgi:hypothetical protein
VGRAGTTTRISVVVAATGDSRAPLATVLGCGRGSCIRVISVLAARCKLPSPTRLDSHSEIHRLPFHPPAVASSRL